MRRLIALLAAASVALALPSTPATGAPAQAEPQIRQEIRVPMSDGVELEVRLGGRGPLVDGRLPARPVIAEFSPYGPGCCVELGGPEYNYLQVHLRGTGESDGAFDALGARSQQDVVEVLGWACEQPWSNGRFGLYGFSASAIMAYNSLHLDLPCVDTAVLGAGTHELYRDLMYPGGIPNLVPATGVLALIGAPSILAGPDRLGRDPLSALTTLGGMVDTGLAYVQHPTLDGWWQERGMRGDVNDLPMLLVTGFFDVESRGPFQAFQELRQNGTKLMVVGAHDGIPAGSGGADGERQRWYDRYLRDIDNGVDLAPPVRLWMSDGSRVDMLGGQFVTTEGADWPLPGTEWVPLHLDPTRSGSATSLNDGSLTLGPAPAATQAYPALPSLPTATDPHTTSLLGFFNGSAELTDMTLAEPLGLSYTTEPFTTDVVSAGPASLELVLSSTSPETDIFAVVSDVAPDGTANPVATGRLRTAYPGIDLAKSLVDDAGNVVQPYGTFGSREATTIGEERRYHVELWPIGNRFRAGHRLRLHIVGASAFHLPSLPGLNTVRLGEGASRLLLPVLPGSDLRAALGASAPVPAPAQPTPSSTTSIATAARTLPATGGSSAPLPLGAVALAAALSLFATTRRRAHHP